MRKYAAPIAIFTMIMAGPAFAQSATQPTDNAHGAAPASEGRAATQDHAPSGNPNGKGNALNGPLSALDATRNNGQ